MGEEAHEEAGEKSVDVQAARLRTGGSRDMRAVRLLLKTLRTKRIRRPDLVLEFAPLLLRSLSSANEGDLFFFLKKRVFLFCSFILFSSLFFFESLFKK